MLIAALSKKITDIDNQLNAATLVSPQAALSASALPLLDHRPNNRVDLQTRENGKVKLLWIHSYIIILICQDGIQF